jgi:hypothetical protein
MDEYIIFVGSCHSRAGESIVNRNQALRGIDYKWVPACAGMTN